MSCKLQEKYNKRMKNKKKAMQKRDRVINKLKKVGDLNPTFDFRLSDKS